MKASSINDCELAAWRCTAPLDPAPYRTLCRTLALDACKWDGQVGDATTIADFAIVLPRTVWAELSRLAEALAAELTTVEHELAVRPDLWRDLGLPRRVRAALEAPEPWTPTAARVVRFDFHPTAEGWSVSEANSDVPGGYIEAGALTHRMADHAHDAESTGDPAAAWCDAMVECAHVSGLVVLLGAPGCIEDRQVIAHLAMLLRARGLRTLCAGPAQLQWHGRHAFVRGAQGLEPVDAVFRFFQGEWMTHVAGADWRFLFRGGLTPVCNPAAAVLSESKRLPTLWPQLETEMPTWRALLPRTQPISTAWLGRDRDWVLKRSYSNTGDAVLSPRWSPRSDYTWAFAHGLLVPTQWAAQAHFETLSLPTPAGPLFPCIGVYTVNGRAAGIYGRLSMHPVTDYRAIDTAILLEKQK